MVARHNGAEVQEDEWASNGVCSESFAASCFLGRAMVGAPPANWTLCVSSLANEVLAEVVTWSCAVAADLPSRKSYPSFAAYVSKPSRGRCFVVRSPGLDVPATLMKPIFWRSCTSCSQRAPTSRCRILPTPRLSKIPSAAAASMCNRLSNTSPRSAARDMQPRVSVAARTIPSSLDSALLWAIVFWVFDHARIHGVTSCTASAHVLFYGESAARPVSVQKHVLVTRARLPRESGNGPRLARR